MKRTNMFMIVLVVMIALEGMVLLASAQEKAKTEGAPKEAAALTIARAVIGTGVDKSEPVGAAETFPAATEKVTCFIEAANIPKDMDISFVWTHGGKELLKTTLPLKAGPRWRTYAEKNLRGMKGDWKVEIKDADGKALKEVKFKVE